MHTTLESMLFQHLPSHGYDMFDCIFERKSRLVAQAYRCPEYRSLWRELRSYCIYKDFLVLKQLRINYAAQRVVSFFARL